MKLTSKIPIDWRDLQNQVARLFNEAGYHAVSPKTIQLVRGQVEVDVFVTANHELLNQLICECKYWNTPIPQEKIHAFRTIVQDSGSMIGLIIAKTGFQSGAIEAANQSNVLLRTWDDFQQMLILPWFHSQEQKAYDTVYPLMIYTDPLDCDKQLENLDYQKYERINESFFEQYFKGLQILNSLDDNSLIAIKQIDYNGRKFDAIEDFIEYYVSICQEAIKTYESFFANHPIEDWKLQRPHVDKFKWL